MSRPSFWFCLVLQSEVQTVNQTEEVVVTIGRNAVGTAGHEVVGVVSIATELWQHIGPAFHVVQYAVVTAVVEGAVVSEFQTGKAQTGFGAFGALRLGVVGLNVVFPLAVTGQLVSNLGFTFEAKRT